MLIISPPWLLFNIVHYPSMIQLFLSRFQFINEILFPPTEDEKQKPSSRRKVRKE